MDVGGSVLDSASLQAPTSNLQSPISRLQTFARNEDRGIIDVDSPDLKAAPEEGPEGRDVAGRFSRAAMRRLWANYLRS